MTSIASSSRNIHEYSVKTGPRRVFYPILLGLIVFILYFSGLGKIGLLGPDEPRYVAIARSMHLSGDFVTPKLFGEPWFEKPPLYYWLAALSFHVGIDEMTARLPSAISATLFLFFWFLFLRRYFPRKTALLSCIVLSTTVAWIALARAASMDMLLSTTLCGALMLLAKWFWDEDQRALWGFYGLLGVSTLAKGFVGVALAALISLAYIVNFRDWKMIRKMLWTPAILAFFAIALPWYVLCYIQNGYPFFKEFIIEHHLLRAVSAAVGHPQPLWFYFPVLVAGLFPWSALILLLLTGVTQVRFRELLRDRKLAFIFYWVTLPFIFFSVVQNKLPGYLLPIMPPLTLWIALRMTAGSTVGSPEAASPERKQTTTHATSKLALWLVGISALLLLFVPVIQPIISSSLTSGLSSTIAEWNSRTVWNQIWHGEVPVALWLALLAIVVLSLGLLIRGKLLEGAVAILFGVVLSLSIITTFLSPSIDRVASARRVAIRMEEIGVDPFALGVFQVERNYHFQVNYYLNQAIPDWSPDSPNPAVKYVLTGKDTELANATSLVLFPGPGLRLWELK